MTDSPTSQAMHLAMTELRERELRIAALEEALREILECRYEHDYFHIHRIARSVLNKETNRG